MRTRQMWTRITGTAVWVSVALLLMVAAPVAADSDPASLGVLAERAWSSANWPAALAILEQLRSAAPGDQALIERQQRGHLNYAWDLLSAGKCSEASAQFTRALGLLPGDPEALRGLDLTRDRCPAAEPVRVPTTAVGAGPGTRTQPVNRPTEYRVQRGDTLYSIARHFGVTVEAIRRASGLPSEAIQAGMTLTIPPVSTTSGTRSHTVRAGDTLYSLARAYGTTVAAIQWANGLAGTAIRAGTVLAIPASDSAQKYTVLHGDTLYSIAKRYGITVDALQAANGLTGTGIVTGMVLVIP